MDVRQVDWLTDYNYLGEKILAPAPAFLDGVESFAILEPKHQFGQMQQNGHSEPDEELLVRCNIPHQPHKKRLDRHLDNQHHGQQLQTRAQLLGAHEEIVFVDMKSQIVEESARWIHGRKFMLDIFADSGHQTVGAVNDSSNTCRQQKWPECVRGSMSVKTD